MSLCFRKVSPRKAVATKCLDFHLVVEAVAGSDELSVNGRSTSQFLQEKPLNN